jgi:hypothetical protein
MWAGRVRASFSLFPPRGEWSGLLQVRIEGAHIEKGDDIHVRVALSDRTNVLSSQRVACTSSSKGPDSSFASHAPILFAIFPARLYVLKVDIMAGTTRIGRAMRLLGKGIWTPDCCSTEELDVVSPLSHDTDQIGKQLKREGWRPNFPVL